MLNKYITLIIILISNFALAQDFIQGPFTNQRLGRPVVADFNGDNYPDVLGISYGFFNGYGKLFLNINQSTQDSVIFNKLDLDLIGIGETGVGDFDGDGDTDIIFTQFDDFSIVILYNDGNAIFDADTIGNEMLYRYDTADIDGDGDIDIIGHNAEDEKASILLNEGNGSFKFTNILNNPDRFYTLEVADFDNDDDTDILLGYSRFSESWVKILRNDGNGSFKEESLFTNSVGNLIQMQVSDFNADGYQDIIYASETWWDVYGHISIDGNKYEDKQLAKAKGSITGFAVQDFNSDGIMDIVTGGKSSEMMFHKNSSNLTPAFESSIISAVQPINKVLASDIDLDGDVDLVASNGEFWWFVNEIEQLSNISDNDYPNQISVYPNPASNTIYFHEAQQTKEVFIFDTAGKLVLRANNIRDKVDISNIETGLYQIVGKDAQAKKILFRSKIVIK